MKVSGSENMRLKFLYRSLIQKGKIKLPHKGARKLIGPDCAYHLYSTLSNNEKDSKKDPQND